MGFSLIVFAVETEICVLSRRQERLGLLDFLALAIGMLGQLRDLGVVLGRFTSVSAHLSRARHSVVAAQAIAGVAERFLEFFHRRGAVLLLEQQLAQQLAHRPKTVLHCNALLT